MIRAVIFDYGGVIRRHYIYQRALGEYAATLRARGYVTAVLSNLFTPQTVVAGWLKDHEGFAPVVISSQVKVRKPQEKIYHIMLDTLQLKPEVCVFVDNKRVNLAAAEKLGFHTIHACGTKGVIRDLEALLNMSKGSKSESQKVKKSKA